MRLLIDSDMARIPRNCHECPLGMGTICFWMPADVDEDRPQEGRPEWCPLSEYKEPKRGRWVDMGDFEMCSSCLGTQLKRFDTYYGKAIWIKTPFCPNCGAKMETGT